MTSGNTATTTRKTTYLRQALARGAMAALAMSMALVGTDVSPAAASHPQPSGEQIHVGHVDAQAGRPCSRYYSFSGTYMYNYTVTLKNYKGRLALTYQRPFANTNSYWHEFTDGSYAQGSNCNAAAQPPGSVAIGGFTVTIRLLDAQNVPTCSAPATYRRGVTPIQRPISHLPGPLQNPSLAAIYQNFESGTFTCGVAGTINSLKTAQVLAYCNSPIAPQECTTMGGDIVVT